MQTVAIVLAAISLAGALVFAGAVFLFCSVIFYKKPLFQIPSIFAGAAIGFALPATGMWLAWTWPEGTARGFAIGIPIACVVFDLVAAPLLAKMAEAAARP